jgi:hypothetical protein
LLFAGKHFNAKECRISSGIGIAGPAKNVKSYDTDFWLQLSYKIVAKNIFNAVLQKLPTFT